jgi:uncharacterized protein YcfL
VKTKVLIAGLFLGLLVGCKTTVPSSYLHADRLTKNSVQPMLQVTAQDHPDLKSSIDDLMTSWELRLSTAEQLNGSSAATTQPASK